MNFLCVSFIQKKFLPLPLKKLTTMIDHSEGYISIRDAARWLTRMAAMDGVISSNERLLLRQFAQLYGLDPKSLYRMAHAAANDVEIPEVELISSSHWKGRRFEEFIVGLCSDKSCFTLLSWRSDKTIGDTYPLDSLMPDLHLRLRADGRETECYIECKYRSVLPDGILDLSGLMERYHRLTAITDRRPLLIALGIGGSPSAPATLYLLPAKSIAPDGIIHLCECAGRQCDPSPETFRARLTAHLA